MSERLLPIDTCGECRHRTNYGSNKICGLIADSLGFGLKKTYTDEELEKIILPTIKVPAIEHEIAEQGIIPIVNPIPEKCLLERNKNGEQSNEMKEAIEIFRTLDNLGGKGTKLENIKDKQIALVAYNASATIIREVAKKHLTPKDILIDISLSETVGKLIDKEDPDFEIFDRAVYVMYNIYHNYGIVPVH